MKFFIILFILNLSACGVSEAPEPNTNEPPPTTKDPLGAVAFNDDIIQPKARFASYSPQAHRISIIDPIAKTEVWGKQVGEYDYAVPHPGFNGATLFEQRNLLILSQDSEKELQLENSFSHIAIGSNQVSYAFANHPGDKIEIVRSLGFGNWQHEVFDLPWGKDDSEESQFETDVSLPLASLFSDDDQKLLIFNPADGKYLWLNALTQNSALESEAAYCEGNGNTESDHVFRYVVYDKSHSVLIAGDYQGKLSIIQMNETCHDYLSTEQLSLPQTTPILFIQSLLPGEILVSQSEGLLSKLTYDENGFNSEMKNYSNVCQYPAGLLPMRDEYLLIACLPVNDANPILDERFYQLYDMASGEVINEWQANDEFSGIGIDRQKLLLHRMLESSLGILQSINLETGDTEEKSGLFLQGLLN